jgi:hypothetical protein
LAWFSRLVLSVEDFSDGFIIAPAPRSTIRRVNGAAPVHREADAGDEIILHEKEHRRGDVRGLPLAPH